jgi:hypothetical protein
MRGNTEEYFHTKYAKRRSGCWEWTGPRMHAGYGIFMYGGKLRRVHRLMLYFLGLIDINKPYSKKSLALHKCDNRICVNPEHLYVGSFLDNNLDTLRRGRNKAATKKVCINGHKFTLNNTYITPGGHRQCRICKKRRKTEWQDRRRGRVANG